MANLETLTIEISADASKASQGIDSLIVSLSALGKTIQGQLAPMKEFAATLKDIRGGAIGGNIWKNLAPKASDTKKATSAVKEVAQAWAETNKIIPQKTGSFAGWGKSKAYTFDPATGGYTKPWTAQRPAAMTGIKAADALGYKDPAIANADKPIQRASEAFKNVADNSKSAASSVSDYKKAVDTSASVTDKAAKENNTLAESTKQVTKASLTAKATVKTTTHGILSQIGRIAKTMLIRTAIRSLMKVAKQGLQNYYQYSKSISGAFYQAVQSIQLNATTAGNQIGAMLGSLLTSLAPILNGILTIVSAVAEAITMLFSLLGGSSTYSKATSNLNNLGKAAGGAGGKVKELLADFDELNVITQESGGGGGGGSGFGFSFDEFALPQWMIEWKPLIEALLAGTLGAIILPKIWEWIKKIFGLGDSTGASVIKDVLDKLLGKDSNKDLSFDIKGLGEALTQLGLIKVELETIESSLTKISQLSVPSFAAAAVEMTTLSVAAAMGAPYIKTICDAIAGLKGGIGLFDIVGTLLSTVLGALAGSKKIKIEMDREEFDKFKKEFDGWFDKNMVKYVIITFHPAYYTNYTTVAKALDDWAETPYKKWVYINFQSAYYKNFVTVARGFDSWAATPYNKDVIIAFEPVAKLKFDYEAADLKKWAGELLVKQIVIAFNEFYYKYYQTIAKGIEDWANVAITKWILVNFNAGYYSNFNIVAEGLKTWAAQPLYKTIYVSFSENELKSFNQEVDKINRWVNEVPVKRIKVQEDRSIFDSFLDWVTKWLLDKATKTIDIYFNAAQYIQYALTVATIDAWTSIPATKWIYVNFNSAYYNNFYEVAVGINKWAATALTKWILINFNSAYINNFNTVATGLNEWASASLTKWILVNFNSAYYKNFYEVAKGLNEWASKSLTKTIYIETVEKTNKSTSVAEAPSVSAISSAFTGAAKVSVADYLEISDKAVKKFLEDTYGTSPGGVVNAGWYSSGGFPDSGELFVARENGLVEAVGSFGNRAAVANNDQIIEGIQRGVEEANSEQNMLLRQQNELLRGILEKENIVKFGASASFGRTVQQSLNMYSGKVGG